MWKRPSGSGSHCVISTSHPRLFIPPVPRSYSTMPNLRLPSIALLTRSLYLGSKMFSCIFWYGNISDMTNIESNPSRPVAPSVALVPAAS